MTTLSWIVFWWVAFGATHIALSSVSLRPRLIARLGQGPFLGIYSLIALATFVPLVTVYLRDLHGGAQLWDLHQVPGLRTVCMWLSGASVMFSVASLFQSNPNSMGSGEAPKAYGLTRITRHPLFMPFAALAAFHLLMHGYANDVAFFGGMLIYTIVGCAHQDARKRKFEGSDYAAYLDETSLVPFAAIASGRTKFVASELPWVGLAIGAAAATGFYHMHGMMFG